MTLAVSPAASGFGWLAGGGDRGASAFLFFQQGQAYIFCSSCLKGWLQALGVGSRSLMVFQWVFVRSDCAPPGGLLLLSPGYLLPLSPAGSAAAPGPLPTTAPRRGPHEGGSSWSMMRRLKMKWETFRMNSIQITSVVLLRTLLA